MATTGSTKFSFFFQGVLYCALVFKIRSSNCHQADRFIKCIEIVPLSLRSIVTGNCYGRGTIRSGNRDLRQLRRGYRMWVICGSPDRFFKEATSTPSELRHVSKVGPAVLPHSLRTRLQCDRVETPFGAGDDTVTDVCQKGDRATVLRNP